MTQAEFKFRRGNPDVLTSIANLSNDEVFTPPEFANRMLDTLEEAWASSHSGASIWEDSSVTFLDPFTKSGVFLREITERLSHGLEKEIPDLQERVNHILTKQVFGIGITQLTALLARRSVYCSKWANGEHSIVTAFDNPDGNIWFERTEHTWVGGKDKIIVLNSNGVEETTTTDGKCKYCGANKRDFERGKSLETHAYGFIHCENPQDLLDQLFGAEVKFDVVIGNPPYQIDDGGHGSSAAPIYNKFVSQAKSLAPRMLAMVIPARWYAGGKGLDSFRDEMINDSRIRSIDDFPSSSEVFPGVEIKGGVCYFLWEEDNPGLTRVTTWSNGAPVSEAFRELKEDGSDVFIRYNEAVSILKKVLGYPGFNAFSSIVSSRKAFGLPTNFYGSATKSTDSIALYQNGGIGYISLSQIEKNQEVVNQWKVFISRAYGAGETFPHAILGQPIIGEPGTAATETYLYIGPFINEQETVNVQKYIQTKFFRFLVLLHKPTQDATKGVYSFVPIVDFSKSWSDSELYKLFDLSEDEIAFIEQMIRPMGGSDE